MAALADQVGFDEVVDAADRQGAPQGHENRPSHVEVVGHRMTLHDLDSLSLTQPSQTSADQFPQCSVDRSTAILRDEHNLILRERERPDEQIELGSQQGQVAFRPTEMRRRQTVRQADGARGEQNGEMQDDGADRGEPDGGTARELLANQARQAWQIRGREPGAELARQRANVLGADRFGVTQPG